MFSNIWVSIAVNICASLFIIYAINIIWNYIKDNYSKPKTKNLVNTQTEKYKKIIEELQQSKPPVIKIDEKQQMYNELNDFMNSQLEN
jgi:hypothetical protein